MRILIVAGQEKLLSALVALLEDRRGLTYVGQAPDANAALALAREKDPHLVLFDWDHSVGEKAKLLSALKTLKPKIAILALSVRPESSSHALDAGADAFICKCDPPERLMACLHSFRTPSMQMHCSGNPLPDHGPSKSIKVRLDLPI